MVGSTPLWIAAPLLLLTLLFGRRLLLGVKIEILESRAFDRWHLLPLSAKRDVLLALAHQSFERDPALYEYSLKKYALIYQQVPWMGEIELNRLFIRELHTEWRRVRKTLSYVRMELGPSHAWLEAAFERRRELSKALKNELLAEPSPAPRDRLSA